MLLSGASFSFLLIDLKQSVFLLDSSIVQSRSYRTELESVENVKKYPFNCFLDESRRCKRGLLVELRKISALNSS